MTEKERVILKHCYLANEYVNLANSDHTLTRDKWDNINMRMSEVLKEIEELIRIELKWKKYTT